MLLKSSPAFTLSSSHGGVENLLPVSSSSRNSSNLRFCSTKSPGTGVLVRAEKGANHRQLTGVVFEPFEEVKKELDLVPTAPHVSLTRQKYSGESEAAINEQIKFYKRSSIEEREHAEKLMEYQNKRGGRVKLLPIVRPLTEFEHNEKGDALYAMELALSLEKLTKEKLMKLRSVAVKNNDVQLVDFVETGFLSQQVEAIKRLSEYVAQLRRVGKGHGVWHFDQMLLHEDEEVIA